MLRSKLGFAGQAAAGSFAVLEIFHRIAQVLRREIRPAFGEKAELSERAFPQKKIGEALLAPGANQEVDVGGTAALDFGEHIAEGFAGERSDFVKLAGCLEDGMSRGVVNGQAKMQ